MTRPLDFLKSEVWLASVGHFLGGYAVILTALLWARDWAVVVWASAALTAYVLVKEYVLDRRRDRVRARRGGGVGRDAQVLERRPEGTPVGLSTRAGAPELLGRKILRVTA